MPEQTINFPKAGALGLNPQAVTQSQYDAALAAAEGSDLTVKNASDILDAVVVVVMSEKNLGRSQAIELSLAMHPALRAHGLHR